jgi:hypothetical protein
MLCINASDIRSITSSNCVAIQKKQEQLKYVAQWQNDLSG